MDKLWLSTLDLSSTPKQTSVATCHNVKPMSNMTPLETCST